MQHRLPSGKREPADTTVLPAERIAKQLRKSRRRCVSTGEARFRDFRYRTLASWSRPRRGAASTEYLRDEVERHGAAAVGERVTGESDGRAAVEILRLILADEPVPDGVSIRAFRTRVRR